MRTFKVRFHPNRSEDLFGKMSKDETFYAYLVKEECDKEYITLCFDNLLDLKDQALDFNIQTGVESFENFLIDPVDLISFSEV